MYEKRKTCKKERGKKGVCFFLGGGGDGGHRISISAFVGGLVRGNLDERKRGTGYGGDGCVERCYLRRRVGRRRAERRIEGSKKVKDLVL